MREIRIALVELLLDLVQDPLFVLGERHGGTPHSTRYCTRCTRHPVIGIFPQPTSRLNATARHRDVSGGSSGPHGLSPARTPFSPSPVARLAGPMALSPKRARMSSTARLVSCQSR